MTWLRNMDSSQARSYSSSSARESWSRSRWKLACRFASAAVSSSCRDWIVFALSMRRSFRACRQRSRTDLASESLMMRLLWGRKALR